MDRYCENCGAERDPESRFCGTCGAPLASTASSSADGRKSQQGTAAVKTPGWGRVARAPVADSGRKWKSPSGNPWMFGGFAAIAVAAALVVIFAIASGSSGGQWKDLDPRLVQALGPQAKASVWCEGLRENVAPEGLWVFLAEDAGMTALEVQRQIYGLCDLPIPANDPALTRSYDEFKANGGTDTGWFLTDSSRTDSELVELCNAFDSDRITWFQDVSAAVRDNEGLELDFADATQWFATNCPRVGVNISSGLR